MAEILLGEKKLTDLKVTELKAELDKRGLSKKGVKSVLVERLKKAILKEELSNVSEESWVQSDDVSLDTSQMELLPASDTESSHTTSRLRRLGNDPVPEDLLTLPVVSPEAVVETVSAADTAEDVEVTICVEETLSKILKMKSSVDHEQTSREPEKTVLSDKCDEPASEEVEMTIESTVETEISLNVVEEEEEEEKGAKEGEDVGEEEGEGGGEFEQELKDDTRSRHQPMDLGSPLDSDPDFDLSGDMLDLESHELDGGGGGGDKGEKDAQDGGSKSQERDSLLLGGRLDRLDSNLDLSYQPASDVLLYEGDPENEEQEGEGKDAGEGRMSTAAGDFGGEIGVVKNQEKEEDEEFMLEVHYKGSGSGGGGLDENIAVATTAEADGKRGRATRLATDSDRSAGSHLWVAGLVSSVRALDLQTLFSSFGQVLSAKVVAKAHSKVRYGYVTVATPEHAERCIAELNGSELKGSTITVEKAKAPPPLALPTSDDKKLASRDSTTKPKTAALKGEEKEGGGGGGEKEEGGEEDAERKASLGERRSERGKDGSTSTKGEEGRGGGRRRDERRRTISGGGTRARSRERQHNRQSQSPPSRRSPRGRMRGGGRPSSPPRFGSGHHGNHGPSPPHRAVHATRDARHDIIRREEQRRDLMERRLGAADPYFRDGSRQVMMDERRLAAMANRRQMELEQSRREQEMARRMEEMREREAREREIKERQLAEQERLFKERERVIRERERVIREREYRERQRREQLEKELRERDQREKEMRERERRLREQHVHEIQARELSVVREREMRQRELQAHMERERELQEKEQLLVQEQQRIQKEKQMYEEQQRRLREEAERQAREREEKDRTLRIREEKERRERERAEEERVKIERERRKQEELKWEREERERERQKMMQQQQQQQRIGKRPYQDSPSYESTKRQAVHDIRGNSDMFDISSNVFSRLDPQKQAMVKSARAMASGAVDQSIGGMMASGKGSASPQESYSRRSTGSSGGGGGGGGGGGVNVYRQAGFSSVSRDRSMGGISYPLPSSLNKNGQASSPGGYKGSGGGVSVIQKGLSRANQDIITAALANIQKSVHQSSPPSLGQGMRMPGGSVQQISPGGHISMSGAGGLGDFVSLSPHAQPPLGQISSPMMGSGRSGMRGGMGGGGGGGGGMGGKQISKLPPEEERYNRRFARPTHPARPSSYKRLT